METNHLQSQTNKYKEGYEVRDKKKVQITVDVELAEIIRKMRKDKVTDRAIRGYARAFLGLS